MFDVAAAFARLRAWCVRERAGLVSTAASLFVLLLAVGVALAPIFRDPSAYGGHDWDEMSAHRAFTVKALREFGQLPLWMPYACGGFSEWGNVQGAPNLVSPWLPIYLLFELRHALRIELLGMALVAAFGGFACAGRFTRNAAARAFVGVVFAVNGRFALQATTGHLWHLQYAYLPWLLWAYEGAAQRARPRLSELVVGALSLASMVYGGGIYPLPHTVVLLGVYASCRAAFERSLRPLVALAGIGVLAVCSSAPKLFAVLTDFGERPRLVESTEAIGPFTLLSALVAREQTPGSRPAPIPQWGWHEYGIYIGWVPLLLLLLAFFWRAPPRERALKLTALLLLLLGFGAFHEFAPWTLLHQVSLFRSQHVPTRWLYPAVLSFGLVAAAWLGRLRERVVRHGAWLDVGAFIACAALALDIGSEAAVSLQRSFWMRARDIPRSASFEQFARVPRWLQYRRRDYAPEALPALQAGVGVLECTLHASLNIWAPRAADGHPLGQGARGRGELGYRGEVYFSEGPGQAFLREFSANRLEIEVRGARVGDRLVINQNFDPGWSEGGRRVEKYRDALSVVVRAPNERVVLEFWPRGASAGLALWPLALALSFLYARYLRRASAATLRP